MNQENVYHIQKQVRNNTDELSKYVKDLENWESEMSISEKSLLKARFEKFENKFETALKDLRTRQILYSEEVKELGNKFVKEENWEEAINQYTIAIENDETNSVFYANRSLCYLKINEMKLAECDCNKAIQLNPQYIKAYMRRASARKEIGDLKGAQGDLKYILQKEPSNSFAALELEKINHLFGTLDREDETSSLDSELILPIEKLPHERSKVPLKRIDVMDTKKFFDPKIIKNDLDSWLIEEKKSHRHFSSDKVIMMISPRNNVQFMEQWNKMRHDTRVSYLYLKEINGYDFPDIFKSFLESETLSEILSVLALEFIPAGEQVYSYVDGLTRVQRFAVLILFLGDADKKNIANIIQYCVEKNQCSKENGLLLEKKYELDPTTIVNSFGDFHLQ